MILTGHIKDVKERKKNHYYDNSDITHDCCYRIKAIDIFLTIALVNQYNSFMLAHIKRDDIRAANKE